MTTKIFYNDVGDANVQLEKSRHRAGVFRMAAAMAGRFCGLRRSLFCYIDCDCRVVCDVSGLIPLRWGDLPEDYKVVVRG